MARSSRSTTATEPARSETALRRRGCSTRVERCLESDARAGASVRTTRARDAVSAVGKLVRQATEHRLKAFEPGAFEQ